MFRTVLLSQILLTLFCQAFCFEPTEEDLKCFNDYEKEIKCSLSTDRLKSCSGYKLNVTQNVSNILKNYTCIFNRSHHSDKCECGIKVFQEFVSKENFTTTLLEGSNVLLSKTSKTEDFIKPKTPVLSVQKTENGNFYVTWDDQYKLGGSHFLEDLKINLTFGIKGELEKISKTVPNTVGSFEIVGKNLQPNTNYVLTATMSTGYNDHSISSDQSTPAEFTTSSSPNEIAKIVIPALCVGLIIIICVIFFCILRMKMNWWDKISKPKLDANLGEEKDHILPPSVLKFSSIHVEIPTLDLHEDKKLYQCFSVLEKGNDADVYINISDDVGADEKCIMKNLITYTNPLYPSFILHDGSVTPSDEGYQAFQGLTETEGQWSTSVSTEQALNACGALKFPQSTSQDPTSVQQCSWKLICISHPTFK
ncbi:interleukin-4 receptor subunit alpha-like isoform X2 [Cyprinus carpio]|nr:interleukin-4 receptor subunit alpha-like isoform X2 [Cyprinus carpio]